MKVRIQYNGKLVTSVRRASNGEVGALGHDIYPADVPKVLRGAAMVMRQQLQQRGQQVPDAEKALDVQVFEMGELLCPPGEETFDIEIGDAPQPGDAN